MLTFKLIITTLTKQQQAINNLYIKKMICQCCTNMKTTVVYCRSHSWVQLCRETPQIVHGEKLPCVSGLKWWLILIASTPETSDILGQYQATSLSCWVQSPREVTALWLLSVFIMSCSVSCGQSKCPWLLPTFLMRPAKISSNLQDALAAMHCLNMHSIVVWRVIKKFVDWCSEINTF